MAIIVRTQSTTPISYGQIGQLNDRLATKLHESGLSRDAVQKVLKMPGNAVIDEMVAVFRKHVEKQSDIIVRRVRVDRTRTPKEVVHATGRALRIDEEIREILATMPQGDGDEVDVYFIPIQRFISAMEVPAFLAQYDLVSDPRAQAAVNEVDPAFADEHPNGAQWGDNYCLMFRCWGMERRVDCRSSNSAWSAGWFLSGVRK